MRVAPVSGDLLVKAALVLGGVALAVWAVQRASSAAAAAAGAAWDATWGTVTGAADTVREQAEVAYHTAGDMAWYAAPDWLADLLDPPVYEYRPLGTAGPEEVTRVPLNKPPAPSATPQDNSLGWNFTYF